jgi:hypothetical protein
MARSWLSISQGSSCILLLNISSNAGSCATRTSSEHSQCEGLRASCSSGSIELFVCPSNYGSLFLFLKMGRG